MSGQITRISDADLRLRELEAEAKKRKSPCSRKPAAPISAPEVFWGAVEAKTHLNFRVMVRWDAVTEDEHGFPVDDITTYEVQAMGVNDDGTPAENKDGSPIVRYQVISKPGKEGGDPDAWMMADMGRAFKITKVKWKARYHAQANGCWGDWSPWSAAEYPSADDTGNLPPAPDFISLEWDDSGAAKGMPYRGLITIDPIRFFDIPGGDSEDDVARYTARVEVKPKGSGSWSLHSFHTADDKDGDARSEPITLAFGRANRKHRYRVFVRSVDRFNRRSDWSGPWPDSNGSVPGDDPNPPENVEARTPAPRRIEVTWDEPTVKPQEVDRYKVVIKQGATTKQTLYTRGQHIRYAVPEADKGKNHSATVYSVDEDGNVSTGVTDSANEAGDFGGGYVVTFSVPKAVTAPKTYEAAWTAPEDVKITQVFARCGLHDEDTHNDDGCPKGGSIFIQIRKYVANESSFTPVFTVDEVDPDKDTRLEILEDHHRNSAELEDAEIDRPNLDKGQHLAVRVTKGDGNTYAGRALVVRIKLVPR